MARPQKGSDAKRDFIVRVRLTAAEKTLLFDFAQKDGLTPSDFIRTRTLGAKPHILKATPDRELFIRGLAELGKIGSNVNQIARALNRRAEQGELIGVSREAIEYALYGVNTLTAYLLKELGYDGHSR